MPASVVTANPTLVKIAQRFTSVEAGALQCLARRLPAGTTIDVDFRDVRECQDSALLLLARAIVAGTARYAFHGLSHHQSKMLGYLGAAVRGTADAEMRQERA